jgi:hypothetical protein
MTGFVHQTQPFTLLNYLYFSPVFGLFWIETLLKTDWIGPHHPALNSKYGANEPVCDCSNQEEKHLMNILEYNAQGATIKLDQRELLLVMALIQEGRESFGCHTGSGKALDQLFSSANVLVEEARRKNLKKSMQQQKISTVVAPEPELQQDASNG